MLESNKSSFQSYLKLPYLNIHVNNDSSASLSLSLLPISVYESTCNPGSWGCTNDKFWLQRKMGRGYEEKFHRKIQIYDQALNYMERCSISITIREIQIKTMRYHFPPDRCNYPKFRSLATYFLCHVCEETGTHMLLTVTQNNTTPIPGNLACLAKCC